MIENVLGGFTALLAARTTTGGEAHTELGTRLIIPWQGKWKDRRGLNRAIIDGLFDGGFVDDRTWRSWSKDKHSWICFERRAWPFELLFSHLMPSGYGRPVGVASKQPKSRDVEQDVDRHVRGSGYRRGSQGI